MKNLPLHHALLSHSIAYMITASMKIAIALLTPTAAHCTNPTHTSSNKPLNILNAVPHAIDTMRFMP